VEVQDFIYEHHAVGFQDRGGGSDRDRPDGQEVADGQHLHTRQVVGDYESIYRLPIQSAIEDPGEIPEVATLAEFASWLTARNGMPEGGSTAHGKTGGLSPLVSAPINDAWVSDAVPLVEDAIGSLVDTFVRAPYLHRVEHSFMPSSSPSCADMTSSARGSKSELQVSGRS
jgi:hypothetical protein